MRTYAKISFVRKFCDFAYVLFTIGSYEFSYVRAAHDDRILFIAVGVVAEKRVSCEIIGENV